MSKHDNSTQASAKVSRRKFFAGAGAVAAAGAIPFSASKAFAAGAWDLEADVVVVGTGGAGCCAAAKAASLGAAVIMLEKAAVPGGTTAKSGAVYWIPNNAFMRKRGIKDSRKDALRLMARLSYPQYYNVDDPKLGLAELDYDLLAAFYDNASRAVEDLAKIGALKTLQFTATDGSLNFPDSSAHLPENKAPMGRSLKSMDANGKATDGVNMIGQLTSYVEAHGGRVLTRHRVASLVLNDKREVVGVEAQDGTGKAVTVRARKGVVFGTGGFTHNRELAQNYLKGPVFGACAVPTNEGDLVKIAGAVGAGMGNMENAWWVEVLAEPAIQSSNTTDLFSPPGDSMFYVDKYGKRVVDEKAPYNDRSQIHFVWDPHLAEFRNQVLFMVWDQRTHEKFAGFYPIPKKGAPNASYVLSADTLDGLADAIDGRLKQLGGKIAGVRLDASFKKNFAETKTRFNGFAKNLVDEDFHRGELPNSAWWHRVLAFGGKYDPHAPNDMLYPLADQGPYYATLVVAGTIDTKGGPRINAKSQILDTHGNPIPGLYGAGNCIASPAGNGEFSTLGPVVVFGYLAGENVAKEPVKNA